MLIEKLHAVTSSRLAVIGLDAGLQTAAQWLSRPGVGLVVVCDGKGGAAGVLTKSDLVRHLAGSTCSAPPVSELMSRSVATCSPSDDVHDVWQTMAARSLQNIPVVDGGRKPLGILDIRDAMKALFEQEQMEERMLVNYVTGIGYQ
ncbi:CBS domain-containing protein [Mesorhizobium sp. IMUNJ23232]